MKKITRITLVLALAFTAGSLYAQQPAGQHNCQHNCQHRCQHHGQQQAGRQQTPSATLETQQYNKDGIDLTIVKAFPTVKSVKKGKKWTEVFDAKGKLLGYALYSKPASDGIKGFNGETPVMIAFNAKQVITGVYMLPNEETQNFAQRVVDAGLFNQWNGLTVKQAKKKKVDTVSGATFTSSAVIKSVQAALETL